MKSYYIILLLLIFNTNCKAQELMIYKHPTEKFEISIPKGWTYSIPKQLALMALSPSTTTPRENFNVNIIKKANPNFDKSYTSFISAISDAKDFKILKQGEKTINTRKYKWLIEKHKNSESGMEMTDYIFFTNNNGEILILTMVAGAEKFDAYKDLFDKIALSIKY